VIVGAVLTLLRLIIAGLNALLPTATLTGIPSSISNLATTIGTNLGAINPYFPAAELFTYLGWLWLYWLPGVLAYSIVFWIYQHLPVVGNG
jgi:hypothetical protein